MTFSQNNKLINCYNTGTIAIWDLATGNRSATLNKVHKIYVYKLRLQNELLASCGSDHNIVMTDL